MTHVILVRHCETAWNREDIFRGHTDISLSEHGRAQAQLLAQELQTSQATAIYSSPLGRARETAAPIATALGRTIIIADGLNDMSFGEWEGLTVGQVKEQWPDLYKTYLREPERFRAPGGEQLSQVGKRAWATISQLAEQHSDDTIIIVTHRVVCKMILCYAIGVKEAGFWRLRVDTASISTLERTRNHWVVTGSNNRHHLAVLEGDIGKDF